MFDQHAIRNNFPLFQYHPDLVYLDSAATAFKPQAVIDAERKYLEEYSSNVGRGLYPLAEEATAAFEDARASVARFIGAGAEEIVFTSGTTDSINTAAHLLERSLLSSHPEQSEGSRHYFTRFLDKLGMTKMSIITTALEHHSNFLPWSELAKRTGTTFHVAPVTADGSIDTEALLALVDSTTAIVAFSLVSNVTGAIAPADEIIRRIREKSPEAIIVIDAAQAVGHLPIDAHTLDADFIAFSGHKMFAPTGIGVLYGKKHLLETLAPVSFGGGMVSDISDTPEYKDFPHRFEAGTPNIGGAIALAAAIDFIKSIGIDTLRDHEKELTSYALERLHDAFGTSIDIIGPADPEHRGGLIAFTLSGVHPHDIAHLLGEQGICVRAGEHCAAPLHRSLGLPATTRISFSIYNTKEDIDKLMGWLKKIREIFNF